MAVPAAMMSMGSSVCVSALTITNVSSQSDTFFGKSFPPASAWMMRARLLMLLLAGSMVLCRRCSGAVSLICMFCLKCGLYQHKSRNLFGEFKNNFYFCTRKRDVAQSG